MPYNCSIVFSSFHDSVSKMVPFGASFLMFFSALEGFLAHLSRRLIGELIIYEGIRRPSVRRTSVRPSSVRPSVNIFKRQLL